MIIHLNGLEMDHMMKILQSLEIGLRLVTGLRTFHNKNIG
ncbi:unnamed protein product [Paramecium sonneborni]|uniref:Uncharacterized protein n=1 Tax=Paramecium sonneborni TaxID=65129 RepID=A0A8S1RQZ5_9CILI|nr:unnamed protein product [Paramecium sonneborni]